MIAGTRQPPAKSLAILTVIVLLGLTSAPAASQTARSQPGKPQAALQASKRSAALQIVHSKELDLHVIQFTGDIARGSFEALEKLIDEAAARNPDRQVYLSLNSPGGIVEEGLDAGRLLRSRRVGTVVLPRTRCNSACAYLFFAGTDSASLQPRRLAFAGSSVGVHRSYLRYRSDTPKVDARTVDLNEIYRHLQDRIAKLIGYLNLMKVPSGIQERIFSTPSTSMHYLTDDEKVAANIVRVAMAGGKWSVARSEGGPVLPAALTGLSPSATAPGAQPAAAIEDALATRVAVSGTTHVTFLQRRSGPGQTHEPRTMPARWVAETKAGDACIRIEGQDQGQPLLLELCRRSGGLEGRMEFARTLMEPWSRIVALTRTNLRGASAAGWITEQWQNGLSASTGGPARTSNVSRLNFVIQDWQDSVTGASTLYQLKLNFSPADAQEITVFIPPDLRAVIGQRGL